MAMGWVESCRIGIKAIDEDHKGLFDLVAAIEEERISGSDTRQIGATVRALGLYVTEHFEREERFMRRAGFPDYEAHRQIHETFRGIVQALIALYDEKPDSVDLRKVTVFLDRWIRDHILVKDMEYIPYLNGEVSSQNGENIPNRYENVTLRVPTDKINALDRFAALLREGGDVARALEQALEIHERDHTRKLIKLAEGLFSMAE